MINKLRTVYQRLGLIGLLKLASSRLVVGIAALPIALVILALRPIVNIRLIRLFSSRIGHYSINTELLLCALEANKDTGKTFFYTAPYDPICNEQLHLMWKRVIWILPIPQLWNQVDKYLLSWAGRAYREDRYKQVFEGSQGGHDRWGYLNTMSCHLSFTAREENKAQSLLRELGIPEGAPFVCLLMRDSQYLKMHMPNNDWSYHDYRDVDINNYKKAAKFLAEKGYYVIRMGKYVIDKFEVDDDKIIDYANHRHRSDFLDIYLSAQCAFMVSTSCGLDSVAQMFRRPILITDFPLSELQSWYYWKLFIPKKIFDETNQRLLSFKEIFNDNPLFKNKQLMVETWRQKSWRFVDNTPDEIVDAVQEMLALVENQENSQLNTALQTSFWQNFPVELPEGMTTYQTIKIRVGQAFLSAHPALLN